MEAGSSGLTSSIGGSMKAHNVYYGKLYLFFGLFVLTESRPRHAD